MSKHTPGPVHPHTRGEHSAISWTASQWCGSSPHPWGTRRCLRCPPSPRTVHPHTRGEHVVKQASRNHSGGSSPHPWGTLLLLWLRFLRRRFIPTPVGNTTGHHGLRSRATVHPHTRGEHSGKHRVLSSLHGSSPHPWGTPREGWRAFPAGRFIPTPVGNTDFVLIIDHVAVGSSPHPWGTPQANKAPRYLHRFIPTPVGNTGAGLGQSASGAVHPHTRGEHILSMSHPNPICGSSPHPWGTQRHHMWRRSISRFIPTPVGNTALPFRRSSQTTVHPHTRGEHFYCCGCDSFAAGSSPHPWGTPIRAVHREAHRRFIPTPVGNTSAFSERLNHQCGSSPHPWGTRRRPPEASAHHRFIPTPVGNTVSMSFATRMEPVHPHTRGEHLRIEVDAHLQRGSSPHPWGTRPGAARDTDGNRFIPTPVGNTLG